MNKSELASGLGISKQMVHRLINRGMPTDSVEAAIKWREKNLEPTQTKNFRIDGNRGIKRDEVNITDKELDSLSDYEALTNPIVKVLTDVIPVLWFQQIGWLAVALRAHGVNASAEQVIKTQQLLFLIYMSYIASDVLEDENVLFKFPSGLMIAPDDQAYPSLIARLNQILSEEPAESITTG